MDFSLLFDLSEDSMASESTLELSLLYCRLPSDLVSWSREAKDEKALLLERGAQSGEDEN